MAEVSEIPKEQRVVPYKDYQEVNPGEVTAFGARSGAAALVFGRKPLSENITFPAGLPENSVAVKLGGTYRETSRQQGRLQRDPKGVFFLENLSGKIPMRAGASVLAPRERLVLGRSPQDLQGLTISWGLRGELVHRLRVDGFKDSSAGEWNVVLKYENTK